MAHWPTCFWQTKTTTCNFKLGRFATANSLTAFHLTHSGRANGGVRLKASHNDRSARGGMHSTVSKANTLVHKSIEAVKARECTGVGGMELGVWERRRQVAASSGLRARERELPKNKADQCDCHDMTYLTFSAGLSSAYGLWRLQFQFQFKLEHKFNYHDDDDGKPSREHANKLSSSQMPLTVRDWSCELRAGWTYNWPKTCSAKF